MKVDNFSKNEIKIKRTIKLGAFFAASSAAISAANNLYLQYNSKANFDSFIKKAKEKREYAKEFANQFFDKSPKIQTAILKPFEDNISKIAGFSKQKKNDFSLLAKTSFNTALIAALVSGVIYFCAKSIKDIISSDSNN